MEQQTVDISKLRLERMIENRKRR